MSDFEKVITEAAGGDSNVWQSLDNEGKALECGDKHMSQGDYAEKYEAIKPLTL